MRGLAVALVVALRRLGQEAKLPVSTPFKSGRQRRFNWLVAGKADRSSATPIRHNRYISACLLMRPIANCLPMHVQRTGLPERA